jgi:hypothetical protein
MLDGKRYFAEFPDEDPKIKRFGLHSAELLKTLAALEKEFRTCLQKEVSPAENDIDQGS